MKILLKGISLLISTFIICSMFISIEAFAESGTPKYGDTKTVESGSAVDYGWVVIKRSKTPVNGVYYKTIQYAIGAPNGQNMTILAGTSYPENWIVVKTKYSLDDQYSTIVNVEKAPLGTKETIVAGSKYPDNWVVVNSSKQLDNQYWTIQCLKGASYRTIIDIMTISKIPDGWRVYSSPKGSYGEYQTIENLNHPTVTHTGITKISNTTSNTLVLTNDGTLIGIGHSNGGQFGVEYQKNFSCDPEMNGDATEYEEKAVKVQIPTNDISDASMSRNRSIVLKNDGTVWKQGQDFNGNETKDLFSQIPGFNNIKSVSCSNDHVLGLKDDGTVWSYGKNTYGQLGDDTKTSSLDIAKQVTSLSEITEIEAGDDCSMALKSDGTVWMWGLNVGGMLGDGTVSERPTPVKVKNLTDIKAISTSCYKSLALKADGTVWQWGYDRENGSSSPCTEPEQVTGLNKIKAISAGYLNGALGEDGSVWTWGFANSGTELYLDAVGAIPKKVSGIDNVKTISAKGDSIFAVKEDETLWAWGRNEYGQLGVGKSGYIFEPTKVSNVDYSDPVLSPAPSAINMETAKSPRTIGTLLLGEPKPTPISHSGIHYISGLGSYLQKYIVLKDGSVLNSIGGALNATYDKFYPGKIKEISGAMKIIPTIFYSEKWQGVLLKQDGTVWKINEDDYGMSQIIGFEDIIDISGDRGYIVAVKKDGTVWTYGNLEVNIGADKSEPVKLIDCTVPTKVADLNNIKAVASFGNIILALGKDGTVWTWGNNSNGQLGDGTTITRTMPIQVQGIGDVKEISVYGGESLALKEDGTVWTWGYYDNKVNKSPVQINGLSGIKSIENGQNCMALKEDGTVWTWGKNEYGELGIGDRSIDSSSSPVQVNFLHGIKAIAAVGEERFAIDENEVLWKWGKDNSRGYLAANLYSPIECEELQYEASSPKAEDVSIIKLNQVGNKTVSVGEELKFTVTGVGKEGSVLTYSASNLPEGADFNSQTGEFRWTPTSEQLGEYTKVIFQATDGTNTSKQDITITVKNKVIKGDIDSNGVFNSIDFAYMRLYLIGAKTDFTKEQLEAADVDSNEIVNAIDFAIMRQVILGFRTGF